MNDYLNNEILKSINERTSIRNFKREKLSSSEKQAIINAGFNAPTTQFRQAGSIIEVTNPTIKSKLAKISGQHYVENNGLLLVFIADEYRNIDLTQKQQYPYFMYQKPIALINAIVDTSLMAQNATIAASGLNIGSVYLGSILNDAQKVIDLLHLPKYTFPLFAMAFGYPNEAPEIKPKLNQNHRLFTDYYDLNHTNTKDFKDYDDAINHYYNSRSENNRLESFTNQIAKGGDLIQGKRLDIADILEKQGFSWQ